MRALVHATIAALVLWKAGFAPGWVLIGTIAALLPDIDTRKSCMGSLLPFRIKHPHRSITHSWLVLLLAWHPALAIGLGSHLLLDMLTPMGIQLLWPMPYSFVMLGGPIRVGTAKEIIPLILAIALAVVL